MESKGRTDVLRTHFQRLLRAHLPQPVLLLRRRPAAQPSRLRNRNGNVRILAAECPHLRFKGRVLPVDDLAVGVQADNVDVLAAGEPVRVERVDRVAVCEGADGAPEHLDAGARDGGGDGAPHGFELGGRAVVFDARVRVEGVGVDVPVYFVGEAEPDGLGALCEEFVHRGGDGGGGDLGEGDEGLEGDGVDGAVEGGRVGWGVHLGVWGAHGGGGGDLGVVAVGAGGVGGVELVLDGHDVDSVGEPAHGDAIWPVAVW